MTSGMPELGSKINIITKADIRYEGRLFTVDPEKCTIALANVRSFGTEDRETVAPVPPQNQVYDYILFRGRDIKDIGYVNNVGTLPNDPAIVQLSVPPSISSGGYQTQSYPLPMMGHMGTSLNQYAGPYAAVGVVPGLPSTVGMHDPRAVTKQQSELVNTPVPVTAQIPDTAVREDKDLISGSSRAATPSVMPCKSPTIDQGVQTGSFLKDDTTLHAPLRVVQQVSQHNHVQKDGRTVGRSIVGQQPNSMQSAPKEPPHPREQGPPQKDQQPGSLPGPLPQRFPQQRGGWINRGPRRGRGRGSSGGYGNYNRPTGTIHLAAGKPKNTLKFENDYDFEQANTEFDKLMSQLGKVKISNAKLNGEAGDKKEDSGNETVAGECEHEEEPEVYYDKTKSFFDNISCEAVERSKGRSQRTDWRTERKLNSETFGVASARRGYRGRGYYRGGGYRGGGGFHGYRGQATRATREIIEPQGAK